MALDLEKERKNVVETIASVNAAVNSFVWGVPAMICIVGVGLLLSFRTGFIQFRRFGTAMKGTFGRMFHKKDAAEGAVTPFQAVCTALAATVGTGNIAGVAVPLPSAAPVRCSGCGAARCWECAPSLQR